VSLDSLTLYHRQRQYREALGLRDRIHDLRFEFATGGICAPLSPVYQLHTIRMDAIKKIAHGFDLPPELLLPIPEELDQ